MQELTVIGVDGNAIVASTDNGVQFRLPVDESLLSHVRRARKQATGDAPKLSPREIQAHIRSGMSAEEVADVTGAEIDYVRRFEGPIVAEREHMVAAALSVPVLAAIDPRVDDEEPTFGSAIRARLESLGASDERWTSWKDENGWIVKLSFTASDVEHDARWTFEPKKNALAPLGAEAVTLSRQGALPAEGLIPKLRAVERESSSPDDSRFDSGAFTFVPAAADPDIDLNDTASQIEIGPVDVAPHHRSSSKAADAAINRAEDQGGPSNQTADLLEALRRRRGERESAARTPQTDASPAPDSGRSPAQPSGERGSTPFGGSSPFSDSPFAAGAASASNPSGLRDASRSEPSRERAGERPGLDRSDRGARGTEADAHDDRSPFSGPVRPVDVPLENFDTLTGASPSKRSDDDQKPPAITPARGSKRGRTAMPSWDEIVFGARTDDD
ncbi:hypothetical protein ALI44B_03110 [Leifsonia sp. ALI-44-B]|uniref:septation protein SepH n=1 Tax=Leifsonia sp. ALI-44-B TaxID=1933776 RepID=UPI00097CBB02|nr:septation protein SepH [Leifsonia sp. ALI-44-B]ONI63678.1 hypothetical protein ALI44B_03110 [Leifsonia sp. ALI-44-B]